MTAQAHPRRRRAAILRRALACIALGAALLTCAGCAATTVDVYVPTSASTLAADGSALSTATYTLDERGNAVAAHTEAGAPSAPTATEVSYDLFGVPIPDEGTCDVEVDGQGQPTRILRKDAAGKTLSTHTLAYRDVKGRLASESYETDGFAWSVSYDRDGWPLRATLAAGGAEVAIEFVYEINDTGVVTSQYAIAGGEKHDSFSPAWTYEYNENMQVSAVHSPDGTTTAYEYQLVADPSAYAMARALVHAPDIAELAALLGMELAGSADPIAQD